MTMMPPGLVALLVSGNQRGFFAGPLVPVRLSAASVRVVGSTTTVVPAATGVDVSAADGNLGLIIAVVVAVIALAGAVYSALLQRRTGKDTVREAKKAADAALASATASDKAAEASAAAVRTARKADVKLEVWRQREETMRMVRWALEQAASTNPKAATIGQNTLNALQKGTLVQPADTAFVGNVTGFVARLVGDVVDTEVQNALSGYEPDDDFELNNGITD